MSARPGMKMVLPWIVFVFLIWIAALACQLPLAGSSPTTTPTLPPTVVPTLAAATASPSPAVTPGRTSTAGRIITVEPKSTVPSAQTITDVTIYLVALEDAGKNGPAVGCGDSLIAVNRPVNPTDQPIQAALKELFSIKELHFGQSGLYNALWQSSLQVISASVDGNGVATVAIAGQVQMGGECDTPRFKGQIVQTILAAPRVKKAVVFLNGKPIDQALSLK